MSAVSEYTTSSCLPDFFSLNEQLHPRSQNTTYLSNGHMIRLLNDEKELGQLTLSLEYQKAKNDNRHQKGIWDTLKYGAINGIVLLPSFLSSTYECVTKSLSDKPVNLFTCYSTSDFLDELGKNTFLVKILSFFLLIHLAFMLTQPCSAWNDYRNRKNAYTLTTAKIECLICKLNIFNPEDSVEIESLANSISDIELSENCLRALLERMNISQILALRKYLGFKKFRSTLHSSLPENVLPFLAFFRKLDTHKKIEPQLENFKSEFLNLLETYIVETDPTVWEEMVRGSDPDFEVDEFLLITMGRKILGDPQTVKETMFKLRLNTSGKDLFD